MRSTPSILTLILNEAICDNHYVESAATKSWLFSERTLWRHMKGIRSVKSYFYAPAYWAYCTKHWRFWGIVLFIWPYFWLVVCKVVSAVVPRRWLIRLAAGRSYELRKLREMRADS